MRSLSRKVSPEPSPCPPSRGKLLTSSHTKSISTASAKIQNSAQKSNGKSDRNINYNKPHTEGKRCRRRICELHPQQPEEKGSLSAFPPRDNRFETFFPSDIPHNVARSVVSLQPRQLLVAIGYAFSSTSEESAKNAIEHDLVTNTFICQDIFKFLSDEIYSYYPCLNVLFMRHNLDKKHWKKNQFIPDYVTAFDIQISFRSHRGNYFTEYLYFGSKYQISKTFLKNRIQEFFSLSYMKKHLYDTSLFHAYGPVAFPVIHSPTFKTNIDKTFGFSDELCSKLLSVLDARSHAFHPKFRNGMLVKISHANNQWGGIETYNVLGYVRGCFTYESTNESILYLQLKYYTTTSFFVTSAAENCFLENDNSLAACEYDCPPLHFSIDTRLPYPLEVLFRLSRKVLRYDADFNKMFSFLIGNKDPCHTINSNYECSMSTSTTIKDGALSDFRAELHQNLHELAWRCIDINSSMENLLQQSYSDEILNWILFSFCSPSELQVIVFVYGDVKKLLSKLSSLLC